MYFASSDTFYGQPSDDFESHVTGIASVLQKNMKNYAYQVSTPTDDGDRTICSRGLISINPEGAAALITFLCPTVI